MIIGSGCVHLVLQEFDRGEKAEMERGTSSGELGKAGAESSRQVG